MKVIIRMRQDYYGEPKARKITEEIKEQAILNCDLVTIFDILYGKSIKLLHKCPTRFQVYTDGEWKMESGEKVLLHGIETCFFIVNNYYVFNKYKVDLKLYEEKLVYPVKLWLEEMNNNKKETYNRLKEKLLVYLERCNKEENGTSHQHDELEPPSQP